MPRPGKSQVIRRLLYVCIQPCRDLCIKAQELGAGIVGITEMEPNDLYGDMELKYKYAICIGIPMRREEMVHVPHQRSGLEVQRVYGEVARVAVYLSRSQVVAPTPHSLSTYFFTFPFSVIGSSSANSR